jgi:hypothetical protein
MVFGSVDSVHPMSKTSTMVELLNQTETVRCMIVASAEEGITTRMVLFVDTMRQGTFIDVKGVVSLPGIVKHIPGTTQRVVIQVSKLHTIGTLQDGSWFAAASLNSPVKTHNHLRPLIMPEENLMEQEGKQRKARQACPSHVF